ncbi:hypothetical protein [Mannheimia varigena]|uniref:hypothetical protein n=1 Tax=Mannheimia varigena TaxID=85404 RepID=UPI0015B621E4|nr:hypothetical protein [Mannheimia varigena]QLD32365.1 hypothetical protein A6B42_00595 [Mannheimia varigena]
MVDIQAELKSVKSNFERKYITLLDLIEALKRESNATYSEIAQYLLLKFLPYEPLRDVRFEIDTGLDSYRHFQFTNSDYLMPYETPKKLYYVSIEHLYFEEVKDVLKMLEAFDEIPIFNAAITSKNHIRIEYKNKTYNANPFGISEYENICFEIDDIKRILGMDFSEYKTTGIIKKIEINNTENVENGSASLSDENNFLSICESDLEAEISKNELQQAQARINELEKQLEQAQSVQLPPVVEVEEEPQGRISKAQRALFLLLLSKLYPNGDVPNTNALKESINIELNKIGLSDVSYNTIAGLMKKT